jgi:acetyl-CoA decarbonylase/synthase, CODH/ACS complex subunit gamma
MALTGLDIFKLLPKTNCKKCGRPTCLAFAMALAQKKAKLEECPDVSEQAKEKLAASAAPPMAKVLFGQAENLVQIGGETVCFRHEEKFHNPTVIGVTVSDKLTGRNLEKRIKAINALQFERVGLKIGVRAIAVVNDSSTSESFAKTAEEVKNSCGLAMILVSRSSEALALAAERVKDRTPLLAYATPANAEQVATIAKQNNCPLAVTADSLEALAQLTEQLKAKGLENMVLCPPAATTGNIRDLLYQLSEIRNLTLKKNYKPLGYPTISFVPQKSEDMQAAVAVSLICKYSGVVIVDTVEPYALLPMLTSVANIYTDPQKPVQVEPKLYAVGQPDENSPLMFTTNFSLTYYSVQSDVEASRISSYILVVDTEGTSVLTAYSGDKLTEKTVADAMAKHGVEKLLKHRRLIIPGYVAVLSGKIEQATNWEVLVGPRESSMLPKYLKTVWN